MHLCLYIRIYVGGPTDGQADSRSLGLVEHLKRISVGSAWNILGKNKNTFYSSLPGCWLYLPWKDSVVGWRLKVRHREWKQRSCQPSLQCHYLACIFLYLVMTWNFLKLAIHASGFFFFFQPAGLTKTTDPIYSSTHLGEWENPPCCIIVFCDSRTPPPSEYTDQYCNPLTASINQI